MAATHQDAERTRFDENISRVQISVFDAFHTLYIHVQNTDPTRLGHLLHGLFTERNSNHMNKQFEIFL